MGNDLDNYMMPSRGVMEAKVFFSMNLFVEPLLEVVTCSIKLLNRFQLNLPQIIKF